MGNQQFSLNSLNFTTLGNLFSNLESPSNEPSFYPTAESTLYPTFYPTSEPTMYDPNIGSYMPIIKTKLPSVRVELPTEHGDYIAPPTTFSSVNACYTDEDCMNLDSYTSTSSKMVYSCPTAKCVSNSCSCGSTCKRDPYSGFCCQDVKTIRGDAFCIENTSIPGLGMMKYNMKQQAMKQLGLKKQ